MMQAILSKRFSALQARIFGQVLEPSDPEFMKSIQGWSLGHRHHPAVMVIAKDTIDVIEAVRFAKSNGFKLAVQSTGHGFVRDAKDGLRQNVSRLNSISTVHAAVPFGDAWGYGVVRYLVSNPNERLGAREYTQVVTKKLQGFVTGSVLPNFVVGDEGVARDQAAYPGLNNMRLSMLKARFDRDNTFAYARTPGSRSN